MLNFVSKGSLSAASSVRPASHLTAKFNAIIVG
jgi:hypothetical protein